MKVLLPRSCATITTSNIRDLCLESKSCSGILSVKSETLSEIYSEKMSSEKQLDKCIIGGTSKIIYTTNGDNKLEQGRFNYGHTIPELTTTDDIFKLPFPQASPESGLTSKDLSSDYPSLKAFCKKMGTLAIVTDITLCLIFLLWVVLVELAIIPSNKRGFICGDISISFKNEGDTISTAMILSSIIIPFFIMWLVEALKMRGQSKRIALWKRSLYMTLYWFNKFMIGFSVHIAVIEAMKTLMGSARPHFLDTCKPDTAVNCTIGSFISDFTCTNTIPATQTVNDSFRSFPSGHASIGSYEGLFMAWFLQKRFPSIRSKWLVPFLQTLCFIWASACAITRVTDNRHHWWDVLFGASIGLFFAALATKVVCHNFKVFSTSYSEEQLDTSSLHIRNDKQLLSVTTNGKDDVNSHHA